jgi:hypothetical protein
MATYTSSQTGNWDQASTWGGDGVPAIGDIAFVSAGHVVTATSLSQCGSLLVFGRLLRSGEESWVEVHGGAVVLSYSVPHWPLQGVFLRLIGSCSWNEVVGQSAAYALEKLDCQGTLAPLTDVVCREFSGSGTVLPSIFAIKANGINTGNTLWSFTGECHSAVVLSLSNSGITTSPVRVVGKPLTITSTADTLTVGGEIVVDNADLIVVAGSGNTTILAMEVHNLSCRDVLIGDGTDTGIQIDFGSGSHCLRNLGEYQSLATGGVINFNTATLRISGTVTGNGASNISFRNTSARVYGGQFVDCVVHESDPLLTVHGGRNLGSNYNMRFLPAASGNSPRPLAVRRAV